MEHASGAAAGAGSGLGLSLDPLALLDAVSVSVVATDLSGVIRYANPAAEALFGLTRQRLLGQHLVALLVEPCDAPGANETMSTVLSGQQWTGRLSLLCAGGQVRRLEVTDSPVWRDGIVVGVLQVALPAGGSRPSAARLAQLARAVGELASADDVGRVVEIVVDHAAAAVDAEIASLALLEAGQTMRLVGLRGAVPGAAQRWATFALDDPLPVCDALRRNEMILLRSGTEIVQRYPALAGHVPDARVMVCLPLTTALRGWGAIGLSFPGDRELDDSELEFLTALADACAQALERVQALGNARESADKLAFLAQVTDKLASSLDYRTTLRTVAQLAVPRLADWCAIHLVRDGRLQVLAVTHVDPAKVALAEDLQRRYPPLPDAPSGVPKVIRTGRSELYAEIGEELLVASARDEEHLALMRQLGLTSGLVVPLTAGGRVLGALTLVSAESGRRFGPADQEFAEDVARRAAIAIDNADLYSQTRHAAQQLQRAVLPRLPVLPGWEAAVVYESAGRTDVGGDFYDVLPLPDGRLAVVVGDVMGRGVHAAAAMAQVRSALRAYVVLDPDPVTVLTRLDRMFAAFDYTQLVTLAYLLIDPAAGQTSVSNAGHPPPLLVRRDGAIDLLVQTPTLPLGVGPDDRLIRTARIEPGDTLLAYTDGLVERRHEDIDRGLRRLRDAASGLITGELTERLPDLVARLRGADTDDDVTALAVRQPA